MSRTYRRRGPWQPHDYRARPARSFLTRDEAARELAVTRDQVAGDRDPGFVDLDSMFEDACADVCGR